MPAKNESKIPVSALREAFDYDAETGALTWKPWSCDRKRDGRGASQHDKVVGKEAGVTLAKGYRQVRLAGVALMSHRVAWALHYRRWPRGEIDHINHIRDDNRISNLRVVSRTKNGRNTSLHVNNTSGVTGVQYNKKDGRWYAVGTLKMRPYYLGSSKNFDEAVKMRKDFEAKNGFHENHGAPSVKEYWSDNKGPYSEYRKEKEMERVDAYLRSVGLL